MNRNVDFVLLSFWPSTDSNLTLLSFVLFLARLDEEKEEEEKEEEEKVTRRLPE